MSKLVFSTNSYIDVDDIKEYPLLVFEVTNSFLNRSWILPCDYNLFCKIFSNAEVLNRLFVQLLLDKRCNSSILAEERAKVQCLADKSNLDSRSIFINEKLIYRVRIELVNYYITHLNDLYKLILTYGWALVRADIKTHNMNYFTIAHDLYAKDDVVQEYLNKYSRRKRCTPEGVVYIWSNRDV